MTVVHLKLIIIIIIIFIIITFKQGWRRLAVSNPPSGSVSGLWVQISPGQQAGKQK
jgi:hypothetical protein